MLSKAAPNQSQVFQPRDASPAEGYAANLPLFLIWRETTCVMQSLCEAHPVLLPSGLPGYQGQPLPLLAEQGSPRPGTESSLPLHLLQKSKTEPRQRKRLARGRGGGEAYSPLLQNSSIYGSPGQLPSSAKHSVSRQTNKKAIVPHYPA